MDRTRQELSYPASFQKKFFLKNCGNFLKSEKVRWLEIFRHRGSMKLMIYQLFPAFSEE